MDYLAILAWTGRTAALDALPEGVPGGTGSSAAGDTVASSGQEGQQHLAYQHAICYMTWICHSRFFCNAAAKSVIMQKLGKRCKGSTHQAQNDKMHIFKGALEKEGHLSARTAEIWQWITPCKLRLASGNNSWIFSTGMAASEYCIFQYEKRMLWYHCACKWGESVFWKRPLRESIKQNQSMEMEVIDKCFIKLPL